MGSNSFWKSLIGLLILLTISATAIYVKWSLTQEHEREHKASKKTKTSFCSSTTPGFVGRIVVADHGWARS